MASSNTMTKQLQFKENILKVQLIIATRSLTLLVQYRFHILVDLAKQNPKSHTYTSVRNVNVLPLSLGSYRKEKKFYVSGSTTIDCVSYTSCYTSHPVYQCILPGKFSEGIFSGILIKAHLKVDDAVCRRSGMKSGSYAISLLASRGLCLVS